MSECCGPTPCCGSAPAPYDYGPEPYVTGAVETFAGPVKRVATELAAGDVRGGWRVRLGIGRSDYRVRPALYAVGEPDDASPVLVTGNYKLTLDTLRRELAGRDAWLLVIDTRGINVWCAAGKGTFGTDEVVRMVREARLEQIVSHTRLVLPQLGATGVAAHEVRARSGFSVVWGPVRASDLPAFLDAGMKATPEMRRVTFPTAERAKLVGVELSVLWGRSALIAYAVVALAAVGAALLAPGLLLPLGVAALVAVLGVAAGAVVAPVLLPWLPGRAFSLKGACAGALLVGGGVAAATGGSVPLWAWGLASAGVAVASFTAMNFTGSSTYTSPSGVEWEMRRAIPAQLAGLVLAAALVIASLITGQGS